MPVKITHRERWGNTIAYLRGHPEVFDRITENAAGGRVRFLGGKPVDYDGKVCVPWSAIRGCYFYPWKEEEVNDDD